VDGWQKNILGEVGKLVDPKSGRMVEILSSQPGCMVYTGNWLSGGCPVTKSGERYCDYAGVAIECQGYPDAVNQPDFPTILLHEGELYCQKIVFRLRTA
jgi:aldose 1-epimerase